MPKLIPLALLAALLASTSAVRAVETSLQLVLTLPPNSQSVLTKYECEGMDPIEVQYLNAEPVFLAFVRIGGERQLFVNVLAASGARYASGQYEWWTKGSDATLTDLTAAEGAKPIACTEISDTP